MWSFQIARLFSGLETRKRSSTWGNPFDDQTFPASFSKSKIETGNMSTFTQCKFYIAVKELIIEWQDYQTEVFGYIYCPSCYDQIAECKWLNHANKSDGFPTIKIDNDNDAKQLIRFVKQPGLKSTVKIVDKNDLIFFPIDIEKCEAVNTVHNENNNALETRKEHKLECEIRPLFGKKEILPIKNAHITVEIILK